MREIEVKAKLRNPHETINLLKGFGIELVSPVFQHDTVYVKNPGNVDVYLSNKHFLRLRTIDNKKHIFNLKMNGENSLSKIEHETEVSSREEMENILKLLDLKPGVDTDKKRSIARLKDMEICIDEVKGLGTFIEVERMVEEGSAEDIQNEMFIFLESLGVTREDRVFEGYDIMLLKEIYK